MTSKEVIEMLTMLKESAETSVGNRIDKNQRYTILSNISPDSFKFVVDAAIWEIKMKSALDTSKNG